MDAMNRLYTGYKRLQKKSKHEITIKEARDRIERTKSS